MESKFSVRLGNLKGFGFKSASVGSGGVRRGVPGVSIFVTSLVSLEL